MKIHEYQGKQILKEFNIPIQDGYTIINLSDAEDTIKKVQNDFNTEDVVVKAQIHAGGRGKGGGVKYSPNFESALQTARTFLTMLEKSQGVLLFISSIAGIEAFGAPTDYSTAKNAIIALAKNMARKLASNVRVNVIAPGNVYFKGGSWDERIKQDKKRVDKIIQATVPMNRFASPEEIADAAVFLCSDRAKFITGATLVVDGGQTVGY